MSRVLQLITVILGAATLAFSTEALAQNGQCPIAVASVEGTSNVSVGANPMKGDTISTGADGALELTIGDGARLKLGPRSKLYVDVAYCPDPATKSIRLKLVTGSLWAKGDMSVPKFEISTPHFLAMVGTSTLAIKGRHLDTMFTMETESQKVETRDWSDTVNVGSHTFPFKGDVSMIYPLAGGVTLIPWGGRGMRINDGQQVQFGYKEFHISNKPAQAEPAEIPFDAEGVYLLR